MALIPRNGTKPAVGFVGTWANMEEDNARTGFAGSVFAAGVPVTETTEGVFDPLTTGKRFSGIALANVDMAGTPLSDGTPTFAKDELFGVADMGVVFVLAGSSVAVGNPVFYEVSTRRFHGATAAGRLPIPQVEFDGAAAAGQPVALRIRVTPGSAVVTAAT